MQMLLDLPGAPSEGKRFVNPHAVDFVAVGAGSQSCSIRLRCGTAIVCTQLSSTELASKLRPWLGGRLVQLRSGFINVVALDAILPNGVGTVAKLRGGSNVGVDQDELPRIDAAMAEAAGFSIKAAA